MLYKKLLFLTLYFSLILLHSYIFATTVSSKDLDLTAKAIQQQGAKQFIAEHSLDDEIWDLITDRIASGDNHWITIGFKLLQASDAGMTDMLAVSLGQALENNPIKVLQGINKINRSSAGKYLNSTNLICGSFANEFNDATDYIPTPDIKELSKRVQIVQRVNDSSLNTVKKECIASIQQVIAALRKPAP